jgi:hypothetical protein
MPAGLCGGAGGRLCEIFVAAAPNGHFGEEAGQNARLFLSHMQNHKICNAAGTNPAYPNC